VAIDCEKLRENTVMYHSRWAEGAVSSPLSSNRTRAVRGSSSCLSSDKSQICLGSPVSKTMSTNRSFLLAQFILRALMGGVLIRYGD
jgi:hypothetical protein